MYNTQNIPTFTKLYLFSCIVIALLVYFESIDPYNITYTFKQTFFEIALWRPLTAMLYLGRIGLLLPVQLLFAFLATYKLSAKVYARQSSADLTWLMILSIIGLMIFSSLIANLYFYGNSFIMIMLMIWAIQHPTDYITLFKFDLNSVYFPIIYSAVMIFLGSSYKNYMAGLLIGLLYGTIKSASFIRNNGDYLPTPLFLKSYFRQDYYELERERIQIIQESQQRNRDGAYFQGVGVRLG